MDAVDARYLTTTATKRSNYYNVRSLRYLLSYYPWLCKYIYYLYIYILLVFNGSTLAARVLYLGPRDS
jgi:hypothetical protein